MPEVGEDRDFGRLGTTAGLSSFELPPRYEVISELRKGERADRDVTAWFADLADEEIYLNVLTIGGIRRGIENLRRRDPGSAAALDRWLALVSEAHGDQILPIDHGRASPDPGARAAGLHSEK